MKGKGDLDMGHLSKHFREQRLRRGLNLAEVARLVGYRNVTKGMNRLARFEAEGRVHPDLLKKLAAAFGVDATLLDTLLAHDRRDFLQAWNRWASEPAPFAIVIRLLPAVYKSEPVPDYINTAEGAEGYAADTAVKWNRRVCLILSRKLSVWFDENGKVYARTEAAPGDPNEPVMRLPGSKRAFTVGNEGFKPIHYPITPTSLDNKDNSHE